jgi:hypothetical protein
MRLIWIGDPVIATILFSAEFLARLHRRTFTVVRRHSCKPNRSPSSPLSIGIAAGPEPTISNHSPLAIYYPIAVIAGTMMILPRRILIGLALMGAVGALAAFVWRWDHRHHVGTMLNLEKLPQSIRRVDCASFGVTDVLERCSFEVEPNDFPILLSGYKFEVPQVCRTGRSGLCVDKTDAGMAHDYCCGPKTGENFHIATIHIATPRDAPHGGTLTILTDASKRRAIVDLYVE